MTIEQINSIIATLIVSIFMSCIFVYASQKGKHLKILLDQQWDIIQTNSKDINELKKNIKKLIHDHDTYNESISMLIRRINALDMKLQATDNLLESYFKEIAKE